MENRQTSFFTFHAQKNEKNNFQQRSTFVDNFSTNVVFTQICSEMDSLVSGDAISYPKHIYKKNWNSRYFENFHEAWKFSKISNFQRIIKYDLEMLWMCLRYQMTSSDSKESISAHIWVKTTFVEKLSTNVELDKKCFFPFFWTWTAKMMFVYFPR